jgi:predicted regulator of Ras-like GTPase activity (Roadblock/LC7/MglB family)
MPFLHWFKKPPASAATELDLVESIVAKPVGPAPVSPDANVPELYQEIVPPGPPGQQLETQHLAIPGSAQDAPAEPATGPYLSVPIGAFYEKLPTHLRAAKMPSLTRTVQIAEEDAVIHRETNEATLPLSILSLSCPEIFARPVEPSDDVPVTFPITAPSDAAQTHADRDDILDPEKSSHPEAQHSGAEPKAGEAARGAANEIKVRLQPILADFPHDLAPETIYSFAQTEAEVSLPLDTIKAQLPNGRVAVPASTFTAGLPEELKPLFAAIESTAEIPIPLRDIFSRLPADAIEIRKDQESDHPAEKIATPFSEPAEEDARRFTQPSAGPTPQPEAAPQKIEQLSGQAAASSDKLQAIFMTDEPLDLVATLKKVAELPGLQSCALTTIEGQKLAGGLGDPNQEKLVSALLPDLFQRTRSVFDELRTGPLEAITIYAGAHQFSAFVRGKLCLTVVHDNRPFKPGVREKIQVVLNELEALTSAAKSN